MIHCTGNISQYNRKAESSFFFLVWLFKPLRVTSKSSLVQFHIPIQKLFFNFAVTFEIKTDFNHSWGMEVPSFISHEYHSSVSAQSCVLQPPGLERKSRLVPTHYQSTTTSSGTAKVQTPLCLSYSYRETSTRHSQQRLRSRPEGNK